MLQVPGISFCLIASANMFSIRFNRSDDKPALLGVSSVNRGKKWLDFVFANEINAMTRKK
jgi:hypothetical protein